MDQRKIYCPNCYNQIDDGLKECPRCFTKISHNLENFLLAKYKIFTLIGVFGALSIYLLTTSNQNGNDPLLLSGSLFSLTLVIILSGICIWDLFVYYTMKNEKIDYQNLTIRDVFRNIQSLPLFMLFAAFFVALIFILSLYVLSNTTANSSIIQTLVLTAFAILFISVLYYPYRFFIERMNNWIRAVIFIFLLLALFSYIQNQIFVLPHNPINVSLTAIVSSILIVLLGRCLQLMFRDMVSMKKTSSVVTTDDSREIVTNEIIQENSNEPKKNLKIDSIAEKEKNRDEKKFKYGIGMTLLGVALIMAFMIIFQEKSSLYTPFGFGVYFLGLTLVVNSWFSQKEEFIDLNLKIEKLSKQIEDLKKE